MTTPEFRLEGVEKRHSDAFCLVVNSLDVLGHESLCLIGPTGAGKSTLLRLLSGIDPPTAGQIVFRGHSQQGGQWPLPLRRNIVTAAQTPQLLSASVRYNVEYGLRLRGDRAASAKAMRILEQLNLGAIAGQDANTLSGGQRQLVALARALAIEPEVLLLDEPTAHLDPVRVLLVETIVKEQRQRNGTTIVWATHNLFQARRLATRIALLIDGKLVEVATTNEIFDQPQDRRTADFIAGRMVY